MMCRKNKVILNLFNILLLSAFIFCTKKTESTSSETETVHAEDAVADTPEMNDTQTAESADKQYAHTYEIDVKKINEATSWAPEDFKAEPGTTVLFVVKHNLEGGPDFHGFSIPALGIVRQINRGTTENIEVTIPADMAPGEYPINCQFHPAHVGSKLIIEGAEK